MDVEAQETLNSNDQQRSPKTTIWSRIFGTKYIYTSKGWTRYYLLTMLMLSILAHIAALVMALSFYPENHSGPANEKDTNVSKVRIPFF